MGLIHIYAEIPANENRCLVHVVNPLLNTREPYTLKLLKVFSKAKASLKQDIPISIIAKDSPYFIYTTFTPNENELISQATNNLVNKLLDTRFVRQLNNFVKEPPVPSFENAGDENIRKRYFNLQTSENTYLFSNNKYYLYLLGYDDNDFQEIRTQSSDNTYISRQIDQTLNTNLTNSSIIYIVKHNINGMPLKKQANGKIKWKSRDKVEDIFFFEKRQNRKIIRINKRSLESLSNVVTNKRYKRNNTHLISYTNDELNLTVIKDTDTKEIKNEKITKQGIWDNRTENITVNLTSDTTKYDKTAIESNGLTYWRNQIVKALISNSPRSRTIYIPMSFYRESDTNKDLTFTENLNTLTENDETYIKLGSSKILKDYYEKIIPYLKGKNNSLLKSKIKQLEEKLQSIKTLNTSLKQEALAKHTADFKLINNDSASENSNPNSNTQTIPSNNSLPSSQVLDNNAEKETATKIDPPSEGGGGGGGGGGGSTSTSTTTTTTTGSTSTSTTTTTAGERNGDPGNGSPNNNDDVIVIDDDDDNDEDEDIFLSEEEIDETDARNFDISTRKNVIGFIHYETPEISHDFMINNFTKETTPNSIGNILKNKMRYVTDSLNINFQISDESNEYEIILSQTKPRMIDTEATITILINNIQDAMFLRLDKALKSNKLKWKLKNLNVLKSENFVNNSPWKNSFEDNLPLLTVPRNAGSEINAYLTNIGNTSCLGLIKQDGEILHPIKMTMRPSQEEKFYIYFFSPFNTPIKFDYPSYLYLHFEIEPFYEL